MKILAVTNMYPTPAAPTNGVCVEHLVNSLKSIGLDVRVELVDRLNGGPFIYYRMLPQIRSAMAEFDPDLIHVMYGGVMADRIASQKGWPPVVVTYRGSDLLGENLSGLRRKLISHYGVYCSKRASLRAAGVVVVARHLIKALPSVFSRSFDDAGVSGQRSVVSSPWSVSQWSFISQPSTLNPASPGHPLRH